MTVKLFNSNPIQVSRKYIPYCKDNKALSDEEDTQQKVHLHLWTRAP